MQVLLAREELKRDNGFVNRDANTESSYKPSYYRRRVLRVGLRMVDKDAFRVKGNRHAFPHGRSTVSVFVDITQTWLNNSYNKTEGKKAIHSLFIDSARPLI